MAPYFSRKLQNILRCHNRYVKDTAAVAIEGIHSTVLEQEITVAEEDIPIKDYLLRKCPMMNLWREQTKQTKWGSNFICKKTNTTTVTTFLEKEL
eukprot:15365825-Ditylum_brightwellii.AAC.2